LAQRGLELEQLVAAIGFASLERDPGLEKARVEDILLERDRPELEARAGVEVKLDVSSGRSPIHSYVRSVELRIQVAAVRRNGKKG
jgi:hypothetical protein